MSLCRNSHRRCNSRVCVCVRIQKGFLLCSVCIMHMLWVYVEHGAGCAQISAKASAQRKQEESDAAQVREYSVSCGLSLSFSSDVNGAPGWLVYQQRWSEISTRIQPFPSFNEGKTRLDESCHTEVLRPGSFVLILRPTCDDPSHVKYVNDT